MSTFSTFNAKVNEEYSLIKKDFRSSFIQSTLAKNHFPSTIFSKKRQIQLLNSPNIDQRFVLESITGKEWKVETAYPLVDKRIIELSLSLPLEMKVKNNNKRYLFKESVQKYISNDVYKASKIATFTLPLIHKNFLNSYESFMKLIAKVEKDNQFNHIDFDKIKKNMIETKSINDKQEKRHAIIVCHAVLSYILYILKKA